MKKLVAISLACNAVLFAPALVQAQSTAPAFEPDPAGPPPDEPSAGVPPATEPSSTPPPPSETILLEAPDGVRFRGAIAASGGAEFVSSFAVGMGGIEGRLGVQLNNLIGLYVQPSLAFGGGTVGAGSITVVTGTAGVSALIDFTFVDRFFLAVGGGVGVLNNPVGPEIHFRIGGYPVMAVGEDGYSRQGLMLGVDARAFFLFQGSEVLPVMQILGCIGYEVF